MQQFQVVLWKNGSIGGVGGTTTRVVAFIVIFGVFRLSPRGLKNSPESRSPEKSPQRFARPCWGSISPE